MLIAGKGKRVGEQNFTQGDNKSSKTGAEAVHKPDALRPDKH
jgi:hypothetical protein